MTKTLGSTTLNILKRTFNVKAWLDWDRTRSFTRYIINCFKKFFIPNQATVGETFEAAQLRFKLTNADLVKRQQSLFRLSILMLFCACCIFVYASYRLYYGNILAFFLSLSVVLISLALAFRYNFWSFQIKQRKLGCSVREWFNVCILGHKNE